MTYRKFAMIITLRRGYVEGEIFSHWKQSEISSDKEMEEEELEDWEDQYNINTKNYESLTEEEIYEMIEKKEEEEG